MLVRVKGISLQAFVIAAVLFAFPAKIGAQQRLPVTQGEEVCAVTLPIETLRAIFEETIWQSSAHIDCVETTASLHLGSDYTTSDDDYFVLGVVAKASPVYFCNKTVADDSFRLRFIPGGTALHNLTDLESDFSCARQPMWAYTVWGWGRMVPEASPPLRGDHGMVRMPGYGIVVYGGRSSNSTVFSRDDMWTYDYPRWIRFDGATPPARYLHGMVYDSRPHRRLWRRGVSSFGRPG